MKSVKTKDDLQRLALRRGASASVGGSKFNSTADKVDAVKKTQEPEHTTPEPVAEVVKAEAPLPSVDLAPAFRDLAAAVESHAEISSELAKSNAEVISEMQKAILEITRREQAQAPAQEHMPPKRWELLVNRDVRGVMQSISVIQTN